MAAGLRIDPGGIVAFPVRRARGIRALVRNADLEKNIFIRSVRRVVHHSFDADPVAFLNAVAVARDLNPLGHLAPGTEDMLFLVGAEKIGAILVPESGVVKDAPGYFVVVRVDQSWAIRKQPGVHGYRPMKIRGLGHHHVVRVRGKVDRTFAQCDCMRYAIQFCLQAHTLRHGVMHASLHESAMSTTVLHVFHVMRRIRGPFLCQDCSRREQTDQQKLHRTHWYPPRLARSERHVSILYLPAVVWKRGFCRRSAALRAPAPITEAQRPRGTFPPYPQRKVLSGASRVRPGARLNGQLRRWEETYNCVRPPQSLACLTPWEFISRWKRNLG